MPSSSNLQRAGVRLYAIWIQNHDDLWYASSEISRTSLTSAYLHNYGLTYALGQRHHARATDTMPAYVRDPEGEFAQIPVYATPAVAHNVRYVRRTANAIDDRIAGTGKSTTVVLPTLWTQVMIAPQYEPVQIGVEPRVGFRGYVFVYGDARLPGIIGIGKKRALCRVRAVELPDPVAVWSEASFRPTHVLNPLDVRGEVERCDPIAMAPHRLYTNCLIERDWMVRTGDHCVHVPVRVQQVLGIERAP